MTSKEQRERDEQLALSSAVPHTAPQGTNIAPMSIGQEHITLGPTPFCAPQQQQTIAPVHFQQESMATRPTSQQERNMAPVYGNGPNSHYFGVDPGSKRSRESIRTSKIVRGLATKVDQLQKRLTAAEEQIQVLQCQRVYYPPVPRPLPAAATYHPSTMYHAAAGYYY